MTDHPDTLAPAFAKAIRSMRQMVPYTSEGVRDSFKLDVLEAEAALAAHDQPSGDEWEMRVTLEEARSPDVSDTPEPPQCHNGHPFEPGVDTDGNVDSSWCNVCGERRWRSALSATPEGGQPDPIPGDTDIPFDPERHDGAPGDDAEEAHLRPVERGGQPDTDDELLAEAEEFVYTHQVQGWAPVLVGKLASALRRKRDELSVVWEEAEALRERLMSTPCVVDEHDRLERELAEARSHGEVLAQTEGTVRYRYNDEPSNCVCCAGPHVYSRYIDGIDGVGGGWVSMQLHRIPDGTHVRLVLVRATADQEETDE